MILATAASFSSSFGRLQAGDGGRARAALHATTPAAMPPLRRPLLPALRPRPSSSSSSSSSSSVTCSSRAALQATTPATTMPLCRRPSTRSNRYPQAQAASTTTTPPTSPPPQPLGRAHVEIAEEKKLSAAVAIAGDKAAKMRIAVFSSQMYVRDHMAPALAPYFPQTTFIEARLALDTAALADGHDAVCVFVNDDLSAPVVERLYKGGVRMVALRCAGYDRVDLAACQKLGMRVARVPTYSPTSVAEMAVALAFALNRNLHLIPARVAQGNYALSGLVGREMFNQTVAVLGTGAIGAEACRIFRGIGMRVLAHDVRPSPVVKALGVEYGSVEEILPQADIVSLHLPLLPSTMNFLDQKKVDSLKPNALVINVSRGGLVDTDALLAGLESGQIGGLGLDVYANEGALFFTDWSSMDASKRMRFWDRKFKTLLSYPQVFVTPHSAFLTHEALASIGRTTAVNLLEFVGKEQGAPLTNEVK
jgi:D-lactate dehydrogenase